MTEVQGRRLILNRRTARVDPVSTMAGPEVMGVFRRKRSRALAVSARTGPTRPDLLTIWPFENGFGIDVTWTGPEGDRRARVVRNLLRQAGVKAKLSRGSGKDQWKLRVGPVPGEEVAKAIDSFVW